MRYFDSTYMTKTDIDKDGKNLPKGSAAQFINPYYLPRHIKEEMPIWFNPEFYGYFSTKVGIIMLQWDDIEEFQGLATE